MIVDPKKVELPADAPPTSFLDVEAKRNEWNLWIALKLIREALAEGRARSAMWLTPFRDQAHLALKFRDVHFSDLVVFDPVTIGHRWLKGMIGGDLDIKRVLNVAISRARGQAIVFATAQDMKKNDLFRRLLHDAARWDVGK